MDAKVTKALTITMPSDREIVLTRTFDAPRRRSRPPYCTSRARTATCTSSPDAGHDADDEDRRRRSRGGGPRIGRRGIMPARQRRPVEKSQKSFRPCRIGAVPFVLGSTTAADRCRHDGHRNQLWRV